MLAEEFLCLKVCISLGVILVKKGNWVRTGGAAHSFVLSILDLCGVWHCSHHHSQVCSREVCTTYP